MYKFSFELSGLPKTTNAQSGLHWRTKARETKKWHRLVWAAIGKNKPRSPLSLAKLILVRFSSRAPDYDGLVSSFKPVIDGLVECGVLKNDKMSTIEQPLYLWREAPAKQGKISVIILESDPQSAALNAVNLERT